ncbi:MAG: hypothetical protein ACRDIY_00765 [Chloroflexota bacterium]
MRQTLLSPDAEQRLSELAKATGRTIGELIEEGISDLEDRYLSGAHRQSGPSSATSAREVHALRLKRAAEWRASVKDLPRTPPLSDAAISRESIYGARG